MGSFQRQDELLISQLNHHFLVYSSDEGGAPAPLTTSAPQLFIYLFIFLNPLRGWTSFSRSTSAHYLPPLGPGNQD